MRLKTRFELFLNMFMILKFIYIKKESNLKKIGIFLRFQVPEM